MFFKKWAIPVLGLILSVVLYTIYQVAILPDELPDLKNLQGVTILDRKGETVVDLLSQREEHLSWVPLADVNATLIQSFVHSEDKRFFEHHGVDYLAIVRAAAQSVLNMRLVSGASTITMQLTRIYWPELGKPKNKFAQLIQAHRIEASYSKGEILQLYLNLVPFAYQIVGIGKACLYFFDKNCEQLSLAESTGLAILPRNPALYSQDPEQLKRMRNKLITSIDSVQPIEAMVLNQALNEPVFLHNKKTSNHAYHFIERVKKSEDTIHRSTIKTTLDLSLQKEVQNIVNSHMAYSHILGDSIAVLVIGNNRSEVLSYVGSADFFEPRFGMFDVVHARRSPGSALKPFIYALALENKWTLSSVLPDIPLSFAVNNGVFNPNNYGGQFSGPRQLRYALANSMNIPALFLTSSLSDGSVINKLHQFGFKSLELPESHYGIGVSLGNGEVSLWELAQAYSTLARGGQFEAISFLKNNDQKILSRRVISPSISYLISDVLSDSKARAAEFGRDGPLEFTFPVAVKTGTSSDYRDHVTVGYTKDYTVALWRGNSDGSPLGVKISAVSNTGVIFHDIMEHLHRIRPATWMKKPDDIVKKEVCSVTGLLPGEIRGATRSELYVAGTEPTEKSRAHQKIIVTDCNQKNEVRDITYINYPSKYFNWANSKNEPTLPNQLKNICGFTQAEVNAYLSDSGNPMISAPVNKTIFAVDPTIPPSHQKLRLEFKHINQQSLQLFVDNKPYRNITGKQYLFWSLRKGKHQFEIRKNNQILGDRIQISVL